MKYSIKTSFVIALTGFILLCYGGKATAQQTDKYKIVSEKVANKNFVFVANSALPLSGRQRNLTDTYDVRVSADSVISYLPYFGKTTMAPMNTSDAGIMFTSTNFEYTSEAGKKKSWDVSIIFKDDKNTSRFNFVLYENGEALLNVTSMYRDPISFRGYIKL